MAQLIENKPPRRALIATLSHFDDPIRVVVLPNRGRPSPRHTGLPGRRQGEPGRSVELGGSVQRESKDLFSPPRRRVQPPASGVQPPEPNSEIPRL